VSGGPRGEASRRPRHLISPGTLGLLRKNAAVEAFNVLGSLCASLVLAALGLWIGSLL